MTWAGSKARSSLRQSPAATCRFIGPKATSSFGAVSPTPLVECRITMRASKSKKSTTVNDKAVARTSFIEVAGVRGDLTLIEQFDEIEVRRIAGGYSQSDVDSVAREEPLEIRVRGRSVAVTMRTPGHDAELAAGFLLSEGLLHRRSDIVEIASCGSAVTPENVLNVFLSPGIKVDFSRLTRHVFAS